MECARKQCEDTAQDFWSDINFIHGVGQNALKAQFPGEQKIISTGMPQHRVVYLSSLVLSFRPRLLSLSYFERLASSAFGSISGWPWPPHGGQCLHTFTKLLHCSNVTNQRQERGHSSSLHLQHAPGDVALMLPTFFVFAFCSFCVLFVVGVCLLFVCGGGGRRGASSNLENPIWAFAPRTKDRSATSLFSNYPAEASLTRRIL
jgi:hypothetical protein